MALDLLLFAVLPYVAVALCAAGTVERYRQHEFSCTSHSSQFLENRRHFWGIVPFHAGILAVLAGHAAATIAPGAVLRVTADPARLFVLESALVMLGLLALGGLLALVGRRLADARLRAITPALDLAVATLLIAQIATGVAVALVHTWGSIWYAVVATPYLWSLGRLSPDIAAVASLPVLVKVHVAGAWLLVALFPFSRLVHVIAVPNGYLWRRPQVVRWYRRRSMPLGGQP